MQRKVEKGIRQIFHNVQFSKAVHQDNIKKLKTLHDQNDHEIFWESFLVCFKVPLSISERQPRVENTLQFVAKFAVNFYVSSNTNDSMEPMSPFLSKLFNFLLKTHTAVDPGVRFRICHFLNLLLNSMGDQAFIDDALCDKITAALMERLLDKSAKVRAQAILALHRLQDPSDDNCPVIKVYMFHASKDPVAQVRKVALLSMGKNQQTLQIALRRTRDIDEIVRKTAFIFISKITVRSLTIKQRDEVLSNGLNDRSDIVKKCVENILLPSWLRHYNGEYINLIRALDVEIGTDVSTLSLNTLFKNSALNVLLEQLPINKETKLIPINDICSENALYWKCLAKHLQRGNLTEELETILPELSGFCAYISDFLTMMSTTDGEVWQKQSQKFILLQLFEIATVYDLADEMGRKKLNDLICNTLMNYDCSTKIIECIVTHLVKVIPDANSRLDTLANIISDIRLPLKETPVTQLSEEQRIEINMKRAKLKVKLLELEEEQYQAIRAQNYLKAHDIKSEINKLNEEIKQFSEKPEAVITEDVREEKSDPETMIKCLTIVCTMTQSVTALTPTLRSLMQMVVYSLDHPSDEVHMLAIKALGIYCILDKELAKKHILMLFLQFSLEQESPAICVIALKGIFDLLQLYGLEYFDILEVEEDTASQKSSKGTTRLYTDKNDSGTITLENEDTNVEKSTDNFIKIIVALLDNANQELRTISAEGLCKLFISQRITSSSLLSRLIILCYNPANDADFFMRQCLTSFFENFVTNIPGARETVEAAYLPTLKILCNAPETSPLLQVDPYDVSRFILTLTRQVVRKPDKAYYCGHNNLAFTILAEILNPNSTIEQEALIKSLRDLHVDIDDNMSKENLRNAVNKVLSMVKECNKRFLPYVEQFNKSLIHTVAVDETTQNEEETNIC